MKDTFILNLIKDLRNPKFNTYLVIGLTQQKAQIFIKFKFDETKSAELEMVLGELKIQPKPNTKILLI